MNDESRYADKWRRLSGFECNNAWCCERHCTTRILIHRSLVFEEGYRGLMYNDYILMKPNDFSGILTKGGTILGSSRQPFKLMRVPGENWL